MFYTSLWGHVRRLDIVCLLKAYQSKNVVVFKWWRVENIV